MSLDRESRNESATILYLAVFQHEAAPNERQINPSGARESLLENDTSTELTVEVGTRDT